MKSVEGKPSRLEDVRPLFCTFSVWCHQFQVTTKQKALLHYNIRDNNHKDKTASNKEETNKSAETDITGKYLKLL